MQVRSLAYQTDIGIRRLGGATVVDCGEYLVVETRPNPNFWWGNFILRDSPPAAGEADRLRALFTRAFPAAAHLALGVDGTDVGAGDASVLAELGVEVEINHVLAAAALREPAPPAGDAVLRRLDG
ncbi:MAG: GNAT family N-acetyltransferase, partial [Ilumatobacteraceae bacterium]